MSASEHKQAKPAQKRGQIRCGKIRTLTRRRLLRPVQTYMGTFRSQKTAVSGSTQPCVPEQAAYPSVQVRTCRITASFMWTGATAWLWEKCHDRAQRDCARLQRWGQYTDWNGCNYLKRRVRRQKLYRWSRSAGDAEYADSGGLTGLWKPCQNHPQCNGSGNHLQSGKCSPLCPGRTGICKTSGERK